MTEIKGNIRIITSVERRPRWSSQEKAAIVVETYDKGLSVSQIARKYGILPSQLFYWGRLVEEGVHAGIS